LSYGSLFHYFSFSTDWREGGGKTKDRRREEKEKKSTARLSFSTFLIPRREIRKEGARTPQEKEEKKKKKKKRWCVGWTTATFLRASIFLVERGERGESRKGGKVKKREERLSCHLTFPLLCQSDWEKEKNETLIKGVEKKASLSQGTLPRLRKAKEEGGRRGPKRQGGKKTKEERMGCPTAHPNPPLLTWGVKKGGAEEEEKDPSWPALTAGKERGEGKTPKKKGTPANRRSAKEGKREERTPCYHRHLDGGCHPKKSEGRKNPKKEKKIPTPRPLPLSPLTPL